MCFFSAVPKCLSDRLGTGGEHGGEGDGGVREGGVRDGREDCGVMDRIEGRGTPLDQ
jgi:hypothetical protein